jgi:DNA-binding MarR family transcriptional regulator
MDKPPREKHLAFLINDVARLLRRAFDQRAQGSGLTRAQWQVLAHLFHNEGSNQAAVAEALEIEPITLSRHIDRLEVLGYVTRLPDPNDRRARRLHLTETVQPLLNDMRRIGMSVLTAALEGVDAEETERMIASLSRMRANMAGRGIEVPDNPGEAIEPSPQLQKVLS